jgi:RNA polymerase sigma-54 factor
VKTGLSQNTSLRQELKINPRLYQAMDLLYMPLLDLQQHLKQELLVNPFLELIEPEDDEEEARQESEEDGETAPTDLAEQAVAEAEHGDRRRRIGGRFAARSAERQLAHLPR